MKHASRLRFRVGLFASLVALLLSFVAAVPSIADDSPDYAMANGWFYSQTGGGDGNGYSVLDAGTDAAGQTIRFWTAFQRLGGVATLGYPSSQVYVGADGFTYQAFQGGVLQWRPERGDAVLANTFDMMESAGKSGWLTDVKGLPQPISDDGSGGDYQKALATRMGWLTDQDIKDRILANPNPQVIDTWNDALALQLYGLPKSRPEQHGPFISQLFQRISVQKWTTSVPGMPAVGSVSVVLGGDLLKEAGLIPASGTQVQGPGGIALVSAPAAPAPAAPAPAAPAPAPAAPAYAWALRQTQTASNCGTTYFTVSALNTSGLPVNGLTVRSWNDYGNVYESSTHNNNGADGYTDRVVSAGVQKGKWYVMLIDGQGRQSSNVLSIQFSDTCDPNYGGVNQIALELREGGSAPAASQPAAPVASPAPSAPAPAATNYPWKANVAGAYPNCGTTYVKFRVLNASGQGLNGMAVKTWNDWGNAVTTGTANDQGQDGVMTRVFGSGAVEGLWHGALVDGAGNQSSNMVNFNFTGNCDPGSGAVQQVEIEIRPN